MTVRSWWLRLAMRGLSFVLAAVALGISVNFVSTPPLPPALRLVQHHRWWFLTTVLLALALTRIWQGRKTSVRPADPPDQWAHLRPVIGDRVEEWVDEVLVRSLRLLPEPLPMSLVERPDAVAKAGGFGARERVHHWKLEAEVSPLYDEARGQLLILGESGTGKTTLLLRIAEDLLRRANHDPLAPIPVIFQTSNWGEDDQSFEGWLTEELYRRYGVPRRAAASFVEYHKIVPLLDGLDELADSRRVACVAALNNYREEARLLPMVVCCRTAQYAGLPELLFLNSAVEVQPLARNDFERWIENLGPNGAALGHLLASDEKLWELATTPLMLGVLLKVANNKQQPVISIGDDIADYDADPMFDEYVRQALAESPRVAGVASKQFNPSATREWLGRLASQLQARDLTAFYPDWIQLDWLSKRWQAWLLIEAVRLVPAIILASAAWTFASSPLYHRFLVSFVVLFGLGGLTLLLTSAEPILKIPIVKPAWHWHTGRSVYVIYLCMAAIQIWLIALTIGLLRHPPSPPSSASIILVAASLAFPVGTFLALGFMSENGMSKQVIMLGIRPPIIRIVYALGVAAAYSAAFLAAAGFLYLVTFAEPQFAQGLRVSAPHFTKTTFILLAIVEPFFLWNVITRHLVRRRLLRVCLTMQGVLPRNLSTFLSHARMHMMLYHVGDGYLFTHPLLFEYFARQGGRAVSPTPLPTRSSERRTGAWAVFAGFVLLVIDLIMNNSWQGAWQGTLMLAAIVAILMMMPYVPPVELITVKIIIPSPGTWNVPELQKEAAEPAPYIVTNAQRATRAALRGAERRMHLARKNSRLINSLTALAVLREPSLTMETACGAITDGVVLGAYLAREDSRPARIPNLTRALMLKPERLLLGDDQTDIATYAAYAAYKITCSSALGRFLFLRRIARVERAEHAGLRNP